jgi:hypothetical protein
MGTRAMRPNRRPPKGPEFDSRGLGDWPVRQLGTSTSVPARFGQNNLSLLWWKNAAPRGSFRPTATRGEVVWAEVVGILTVA